MSSFGKGHFSGIRLFVLVIPALFLSGCLGGEKLDGVQFSSLPPARRALYEHKLRASYQANPTDRKVLMAYADVLAARERWDEAVAVLQSGVLLYPDDKRIAAFYGKALASNGRLHEALAVIRAANSATTPDWRLLSAEGAVLDCLGDFQEARLVYERALGIAPNSPELLNNYAMSFLLSNRPVYAEKILRKAIAMPGADQKIGRNLAMALAVQGRFAEAEDVELTISSSEEEAAMNMEYLKKTISYHSIWDDGATP